jgi:dipeptidyl aminopeptidase/acylaminoacyl peptidase
MKDGFCMKRSTAAILAAAILLCGATSGAGSQTIGENDYRLLVGVGNPAISPDGTRVVTIVSRTIWNDDKETRKLVSIDMAGSAQRVLVTGRSGLSQPAFSPDGTQIAFVADAGRGDDERAQIFVMPRDGGPAVQVTHAGDDVDEFAWRPDGRAIAYAADDPLPHKTGADRFRNSFIFTTEPITAKSVPRPDHLFVQTLAGGAATQLTFGTENASQPSWAPDGSSIAFTDSVNAIANDSDASHAAIVDVSTKRVRALTGRSVREGQPIFSPDGSKIAYSYVDGDSQTTITQEWVTTPAGGPGAAVTTSIDRPIGDAVWSSDSKSIVVTVPDRTTQAFYRVPEQGGTPQRIAIGNLTPGSPMRTTGGASTPELTHALAKNGTLAFTASWTAQPPELFAVSAAGNVEKLTDFNAAMSRFMWGTAERIEFSTTTGVTADGVLYLPPGYSPKRKYPAVVFIHGGPGDPTMMTFDFWAQVMAARGWLVLRPNYRGSPNLGYTYQHAILYDPEDGPGKDIMAALDAVRARGIVDDARIAVCGWSYGGIMTSWLISKYHIWKAAVSGASVNDWVTDYGTADDSAEDAAMLHGSPFTGDDAEWRKVSAITYAGDVTTPVLILSDTGDNRDPFATSSMYWRALRDNHKDATLRVWPIAGHFPDSDPVRTVDIYHYWIDYISQHFR